MSVCVCARLRRKGRREERRVCVCMEKVCVKYVGSLNQLPHRQPKQTVSQPGQRCSALEKQEKLASGNPTQDSLDMCSGPTKVKGYRAKRIYP